MAKKVANKTASKKAAAKSAPKTKKNKFIYLFGAKTDGDATMRNLLGGNGPHRAPRSSGIHNHNGSLRLFLQER